MNSRVWIGASAVLGLTVGAVSGYLVARKLLEMKYEKLAEREIAEAKEFYQVLYKKDGFETPEEAAKTLGLEEVIDDGSDTAKKLIEDRKRIVKAAESLRTYRGIMDGGEDDGKKNVNIFTTSDQELPSEDDLRDRTEEAPYVITKDEFLTNETQYTQVCLTYYEGDEVLADDQDQIVPDLDSLVGENNVPVRFGYRSKDPNIVYVRNDSLDIEFEILRSTGKYSEEVAGFRK